MANSFRIVLFFLLFSELAHAGFFAPRSSACGGVGSACRLTADEAKSDYASSWPWPAINTTTGQCGVFTLVSGPTWNGNTASFTYTSEWAPPPPNNVVSGAHTLGTCTFQCPTGFVDNNAGACVPAQSVAGCTKGHIVGACVPSAGPTSLVCNSTCEALVVSASNQFISASGVPSTCGEYELTGNSCQPSQPQAVPNTGSQCPDGQVAGEFNGQSLCLPAGSSNPITQTSATTSATSTASGTATVQQITVTSCTGSGSCSTTTTTTTVNNPVGGGTPQTTTESETKTESEETFCAQNPNAVVCKESKSSFGGSCGAFTCEGDAVQCAIAREQHDKNCVLFNNQTSLSDLGNKVGSGVEDLTGAGLTSAANREIVNLATSLDESKALPVGCVSDRSYSLWGGVNFTIPFSSLCPYLEFMGSIVLAFAYLAAARIVGVV